MSYPSFSFPPSAPYPPPNNLLIFSPHFSAPYEVDLFFIRKCRKFVVKDINNNIIFKVKNAIFSSQWVLVDPNGNPIVTLRPKKLTAHSTWKVFRGKKTNSKDFIFKVKRSSMFQWKKLDLFLANNTKERICDFEVKGNWSMKSCAIYARGCSTLVAQVHKKTTNESVLNVKDNFILTVCPNEDYGFMVVLILILTFIYGEREANKKSFESSFSQMSNISLSN